MGEDFKIEIFSFLNGENWRVFVVLSDVLGFGFLDLRVV